MKIRFITSLLLLILFICSWTAINPFPTAKIERIFEQLLDKNMKNIEIAYTDSTSDIDSMIFLSFCNVSVKSYKKIKDANLKKLLPSTDFYFLIVRNSAHYEYNNGNIQTIAAISKIDTNDIRLFLPKDYSLSSPNFLHLFYRKPILNKEQSCKSITNLFIKTYTKHLIYCNKKFYNLHQTTSFKNNLLTVTTFWTDKCTDWQQSRKTRPKVSKKTFFYFKGDILVNVEYNDWAI